MQNHNEISPHTCQNDYHQKINERQVLVRMWRKGNPCVLLVGLEIGAATIETVWKFFKKLKIELPMTQQFYF